MRIWGAEDEGSCNLAADCRCANAGENFYQIKRKWAEEYRSDARSIRNQLAASERRSIWEDER